MFTEGSERHGGPSDNGRHHNHCDFVVGRFHNTKKPIKIVLKLVLNTVIGFIALFALNWLGSFVGIPLPINWLNAVLVGVLGVPGVALVLLLQWLVVI
jgi:inhibitor of the pro-sigma K processing machinery